MQLLGEMEEFNRGVRAGAHGMQPPDGTQAIANLGTQREFLYESYRAALGAYGRSVLGPHSPEQNSIGIDPGLTPREREVLVLIGNGNSTKKVASALGIAFKTAACHRSRILNKLDVHNTADLTRAAMRMGLIGA